jgi:hypothetical protein
MTGQTGTYSRGEILLAVEKIASAQRSGVLGGEQMPEDAVRGAELTANALLDVLTLPMALNYQRNSYALWQAVRSALDDAQDRWVFSPRLAADASIEELRRVLDHHRIALQPNRHPLIWQRVSRAIAESSEDQNVVGLLASCSSDIAELTDVLRVKRRKEFPYLAGPKIFNYWLYVLELHGGVVWQRRELISIAPDTHILQASVRLGVVGHHVLDGTERSREETAAAWRIMLDGTGLASIDLHTPLWFWSRLGFPEL